MDCIKVKTLLIDYIDGILDPEIVTEVRRHLSACPGCHREYEQMKDLLIDLQQLPLATPSDQLRKRFLDSLSAEKERLAGDSAGKRYSFPGIVQWITSPSGRIAAGFLILITGFLMGFILNPGPRSSHREMEMLRNEIDIMKHILMISKLEESSASQRIQAVSYIRDQEEPGEEMIMALINTMNRDGNVNVRMAAATALSKYTGYSFVKDALINALNIERDPLMQITLIQLISETGDERAVDPLNRIIESPENADVVKSQAMKGLRTII
ncbi:MAG: HEAT repeat domain-containing protein [Bacteroidetes bacterium]|nr:HEAT repeat domain-containing protein [Bacteroidota bacterium]